MSSLSSIFSETISDIINTDVKYSTVKAGTGLGKSSTFPAELVKYGNSGRKVLTCVPTRIAARSLCSLARDNKTKFVNIDFKVGYSAEGEVDYCNYKSTYIRNVMYGTQECEQDNDDQLVYCTTGHLYNLLIDWIKYLSEDDETNPRRLDTFDFVIIDEAHLGTLTLDMCIRMLKFLLVSYPMKGVPKVICTSAVYNEPKLYDLLQESDFHTHINYFSMKNLSFTEVVDTIPKQLPEILDTLNPGIALIFLPGIKEIKRVERGLLNNCDSNKVELFIGHSSQSKEQMASIFTPNTPGKWKVILSTNIAETSVTIENLSLIVDCMFENIRVVGSNDTTYNEIQHISKDSATQRAGRTGRTCDGVVIRLIAKDDYDNLDQKRVPEIERLPIINELLTVLDCNIDTRFIFGDINNGINRSISESQGKRLNKTINNLMFLKAIDKCGDYHRVTERGKFVGLLPVGVKAGVLIYNCLMAGIPIYPIIVLSVMLESAENLFEGFRPNSKFVSKIPLAVFILPWLELCSSYGTIGVSYYKLDKFCKTNMLNYETMKDAQKKIINCINGVRKYAEVKLSEDFEVDIFMFDPEQAFMMAKSFLDEIYFSYKTVQFKKKMVYVNNSNRGDIKFTQKLSLDDRYLNYESPPNRVVSIVNVKQNFKPLILVWYPFNYVPVGVNLVLDVEEETQDEEDEKNEDTDSDDEFENRFNRTYVESYRDTATDSIETIGKDLDVVDDDGF